MVEMCMTRISSALQEYLSSLVVGLVVVVRVEALAAAGVCVRMCVCAHAHMCACMSVSFMRMHKNLKCHSFSSLLHIHGTAGWVEAGKGVGERREEQVGQPGLPPLCPLHLEFFF